MDKNSKFSERLKKLRLEKGLSQKELAERIGLTAPAITAYEKGNRSPNGATLTALSNVFMVSPDYLLGHSDEPNMVKPWDDLENIPELSNSINYIKHAYEISDDNQKKEIRAAFKMIKDLLVICESEEKPLIELNSLLEKWVTYVAISMEGKNDSEDELLQAEIESDMEILQSRIKRYIIIKQIKEKIRKPDGSLDASQLTGEDILDLNSVGYPAHTRDL